METEFKKLSDLIAATGTSTAVACAASAPSFDPTPGNEQTNHKERSVYSHIPKVNTWREVIEHWERGCCEKNLSVPLKNWPVGSRTDALKHMYADRKLIALEHARLGEHNFIYEYDANNITLKELKKRIRTKRAEHAFQGENERTVQKQRMVFLLRPFCLLRHYRHPHFARHRTRVSVPRSPALAGA